MKKVIFIFGGIRSGKSGYAVNLAKKTGKKVLFIATAAPLDKEMKKRIKLHKLSRPRHWKLIEEGKKVDTVLSGTKIKYDAILIDCLGFLVSNLMAENLKDKIILNKIEKLADAAKKTGTTVILVSNEVGSGLVPINLLARRFSDLLGFANQIIAKKSDKVIFMHAGIPVIIKGDKICGN